MTRLLFLWALSYLALCTSIVHAEKADQDKPIILEAESVSVNDVQQIYDLKGQILLIKGSMVVTGDDGHIQVDPEGYGFLYKSLVEMRNQEFAKEGMKYIDLTKDEMYELFSQSSFRNKRLNQII